MRGGELLALGGPDQRDGGRLRRDGRGDQVEVAGADLPLVPGCASSEVNGLTYDELRQTLFAIARAREVIGFDLVEVNPMLDVPADNTSQLAAQLIIEFLGRLVEHPGYRKRHPMRSATRAPRGHPRTRGRAKGR